MAGSGCSRCRISAVIGMRFVPFPPFLRVTRADDRDAQGNVIIYFPNGSSIWYGRATPADVAAIVCRSPFPSHL